MVWQEYFVVDRVVHVNLGHLLDRYELQLRDKDGRVFWGPGRFEGAKTVNVTFGDTAWVLSLRPRPGPELTPSPLVLGTGGGGLFGVLMLLFAIHRTWSHQARLDAAIREETAQLRERNRRLEEQIAARGNRGIAATE